jgi:hypothetical protein
VEKLQGCFYFGNGISPNLSQVRQIQDGGLSYLRMLRYRSEEREISHVINNMDCICSLAAHTLNLKCFIIDLAPLTGVEMGLITWDDMSLETCANLLTNAHLWKSFQKLQVLQLGGCFIPNQIPKELFSITTLMELDLEGSSNLRTIPEGLGNLSSLTTLCLGECTSLTTISKGLGNLNSLATLDLRWCTSLTTIPEGLGNLSSLASLYLSGCKRLTTIPEGLGNLRSLATLELRECTSLTTIPEGLGNLSSLATLDLNWCTRLTTIPEGLGNLSSLVWNTICTAAWLCRPCTDPQQRLGSIAIAVAASPSRSQDGTGGSGMALAVAGWHSPLQDGTRGCRMALAVATWCGRLVSHLVLVDGWLPDAPVVLGSTRAAKPARRKFL